MTQSSSVEARASSSNNGLPTHRTSMPPIEPAATTLETLHSLRLYESMSSTGKMSDHLGLLIMQLAPLLDEPAALLIVMLREHKKSQRVD